MNISLEYRLSQKEFKESLMICHQVFGLMRGYFYYRIMGILSFISAVASFILGIVPMDFGSFILSLYLLMMGFFLMPQVQSAIYTKRVFKHYPFLGEPVQVSIDDNLFTYKNSVSKAEHTWQTIRGVAESDAIFVVMHPTNVYYVLPKKAFANQGNRI
ncbi:hypothetical protein NG791_20150 [Laspinema sp. D1]|uniref:YcxB family protein n=1 Tax=Laspinema palackyanum TaxID=3231601 RepID=UPI0034786AB0|nr:hypothetical protein [Laspinema sp. D2b]